MEAKELRIGNLLKINDLFVSVNRIESNKFWCTHKEIWFFQGEETSPIPLTEEILLKCKGMFKSENQLSIDRFVLSFQQKYNFWYVLDSISLTYISKIEFLHEWLNLYFFLNGEEIEINL